MRDAGLRPAEFWKLTPAELFLIVGADHKAAPLARTGLEALLNAFPDEKGGMHEI